MNLPCSLARPGCSVYHASRFLFMSVCPHPFYPSFMSVICLSRRSHSNERACTIKEGSAVTWRRRSGFSRDAIANTCNTSRRARHDATPPGA